MAVKASNQVSVIDLTDGYSVILSNDNYTFLGDTDSVNGNQTTSTTVMAMQGSSQIACSVGTITCPNGVSAVSDGKSPSPTITITATSAVTSNGVIDIPITIAGGITIHKKFTYSIAFTGAKGATGAKGDTQKATPERLVLKVKPAHRDQRERPARPERMRSWWRSRRPMDSSSKIRLSRQP